MLALAPCTGQRRDPSPLKVAAHCVGPGEAPFARCRSRADAPGLQNAPPSVGAAGMVSSSVLISVLSSLRYGLRLPFRRQFQFPVCSVVVPGISASGLREAANSSRQASPPTNRGAYSVPIFAGINFPFSISQRHLSITGYSGLRHGYLYRSRHAVRCHPGSPPPPLISAYKQGKPVAVSPYPSSVSPSLGGIAPTKRNPVRDGCRTRPVTPRLPGLPRRQDSTRHSAASSASLDLIGKTGTLVLTAPLTQLLQKLILKNFSKIT